MIRRPAPWTTWKTPATASISHRRNVMDITDFAEGQIWAMKKEELDALGSSFQSFLASKEIAIEAARFMPPTPAPEKKPYAVQDAVAIIPISSAITKRPSFYTWLFGGAAIPDIISAIQTAMADGAIRAIVLAIDSPGGTVFGLESVSQSIRDAIAAGKPVVSYADGMMTSAAYWIGSAAQTIVAEQASVIGSIGVLMVHYDYSENDKQYGLKRTYLSAGKYKTLGNDAEPLSLEARAMYEGQLNHYYGIFIDAVAKQRGIDAATVIEKMADGRMFIGTQALEAGLVDRIGNQQTAVEAALSLVNDSADNRRSFTAGGNSPGKEFVMGDKVEGNVLTIATVAQLAAAYPALVEAIRKEGAAGVDAAALKMEGTAIERERIIGLAAIQFGTEAGEKFKAIVAAGVTVEQFQAISALNPAAANPQETADEVKRREMLAAIQGAGAQNPGAGQSSASGGEKDFMALVSERMAVNKGTKTAAMQAVMKDHPEAHKAWLAKMNA
jgi:signal peptide peptidase SppA